ncbi:MAG: mandelate racemase/muconate lactonizing enzyme family protein [Chloroflexota bacterium]|nr:mandelate racemase/muconate lactonizing enzyme family protein [Chloroflexota bacterium]
MKIVALETLQLGEFPNLLWLRLHTEDGLVGLGETFFGPAEVATYLHQTAGPRLLGRDALAIDALRVALKGYVGTRGTGVECRGNSAVDLALWDILGKVTQRPVYQLLGGASREAVRVYNTCAGYRYVRAATGQTQENWGLPSADPAAGLQGTRRHEATAPPGAGTKSASAPGAAPYEDLDAWLDGRAGELAQSLLEQGITGMKMWPFDPYAYTSGGLYLSDADLDRGLEPFRQVRRAVGRRMDLMVELHGLWSLPPALKIARAFEAEGLSPCWIEDPLRPDDIASLARFAQGTSIPTTASELLGGRQAFRELLEARAAGVVMLDLGWCGGLSEGKAIAGMAEAFGLPIAPHDCTGPVVWAAGVHLSLNAPNTLIQEVVRAFFTGWYTELVTGLPVVDQGFVRPGPGPGLGIDLRPGLVQRPDATLRRSQLPG